MDSNKNFNNSNFDSYYDFFPSLEDERTAKKTFSKIGFSLFLYWIVCYVVIIGFSMINLMFIEPMNPDLADFFANDTVFNFLFSEIVMYGIALPILYLLIKNIKVMKVEKRSSSFKELFLVFCVSEAFMFIGNSIGVSLNGVIGALLGKDINNNVESLVNEIPIFLIVLFVVIIGPIVEEFIFRKLLIDRLSVYGDVFAITFSSIAFGMFHGNFYQLFYATALGFVLGYIYVRTRSLKHSCILHMIINFVGSVVALYMTDLITKFTELSELLESGQTLSATETSLLGFYSIVLSIYSLINYALIAIGVCVFIVAISRRSIKLRTRGLVRLDSSQAVKFSTLNVGSILFIAITVVIFALNILA